MLDFSDPFMILQNGRAVYRISRRDFYHRLSLLPLAKIIKASSPQPYKQYFFLHKDNTGAKSATEQQNSCSLLCLYSICQHFIYVNNTHIYVMQHIYTYICYATYIHIYS